MEILIVCQFYHPENFTITRLAEHLARSGHIVHVLTGQPNYGFGDILPGYENVWEETINGVQVHRVPIVVRKKSRLSIVKNYLSFWRNSKKWVRKTRVQADVVFSMSLSPVTILSAANLYKKKFHVQHVCHCVDLWPESVAITHAVKRNSLVFKVLYKWSRSLYSKCDRIIIGSPSFMDYFSGVLKLPTNNISFVPQTSLMEDFSEVKPKRFDSDFDIVYCGNIGTIQGIENVPEAVSKCDDLSIKFHVIGMGTNTQVFLDNIKKFHVEGQVIYHGPMPIAEASPYLIGSDAIYVSLNSEGYVGKTIPNKLIMSMSMSRPIIGVLQGDGEKVSEEAGGVFLSEEDPSSISSTLMEALKTSEKELAFMGGENLKYYKTHFSTIEVSSKIEVILLDCAKEGIQPFGNGIHRIKR